MTTGAGTTTVNDAAGVPAGTLLRVGEWTVDPALNQLSAKGRTVRIEPKAMAVLCCLAERAGQVVSREALHAAAWSGVVVCDDALTQVVVKLRRALGDSPDEPAYIQTIPKGGYRLVAPVAGASPAAGPPARSSGSSRAARLYLPWAAAALLALGVAGWIAGVADSPGGDARPQARPAVQPTVVVQPFQALGDDPQERLIARGLTADLVTDLSRVAGLWVVAPGSVEAKGEGNAEGAPIDYVVSGAVQRFGDRMRVHVRLAEARSGKQLWSERYDRPSRGLFEIQDELGPKILELLPVKVSDAQRRRLSKRYTRNVEAYEIFQRGQMAMHVRRKAENAAARDLFRQAIALDAGFARAYAALAMTHVADYRNQWGPDGAAALARAFELARASHEIDPDLPETHWVLAFVHVHRREHDKAIGYLEAAIRKHPSFADGHAMLGGVYTSTGRPREAVQLLRTAMRLAPESGYLYFMLLGRAYLFLGDPDQARANLRHALERNPEFIDARVYMAAAHVVSGDMPAAAWEAEEIRALQPDFTVHRWLETNPTADPAMRESLVRNLARIGF